MSDTSHPENRRDFLALAATTAAAGLGAMLPIRPAAAAEPAPSGAAAVTQWLDSIPGKYRQVVDWPEENQGMGLAYTFAFLRSAAAGWGVSDSDIGAVLVIRHNAVPMALNDSVWAKYKLGEAFEITDRTTSAPAVRNPYYSAPIPLPFPEMALSALIERGVRVAACGLAIEFRSGRIAEKMGLDPAVVKQEWLAAVHPGITVMPSGVFACHAAGTRGCTYLYAG
jgi:hypothetical protein